MPILPDWSPSAHSYVTALTLAKASQAAYCLADYSPGDWGREYGFAITELAAEKNGMYAFAASHEDTIVFAVRGTDHRPDWLVNINMDHTTIENIPGSGGVHIHANEHRDRRPVDARHSSHHRSQNQARSRR